ncbi:nucleotidyl transferase AbiEii/AbiGii toxin family protein [Streptomyces qinzhouensis]|uniref:Nucleotidyl transferase AbiEii/AbiGii toxin family protein n=1 Tax=Streptomyces qinzhouensis TaxID=2599401 RepID=A0A5B8J8S4_9ACTN|nr:nucleotidyl transferase AbiEii/AbiGii toxin family protein [Streptomyces qinzhouensis]QDY78205.1 nucleotidyl transferase AbiEii/AbiGii toxin family protein [Streptomyces qinzhouensis]
MDDLHLRLIRLGLEALSDDFGFALAGGYAVQAHHIVQRLSDDVDLFAPIERRGEMPAATERIVAVLGKNGYRVEILQQAETYVRLMVSDPVSGQDTKIELVAEFLRQPPVASEWGPVLHRDDVAAGKMEALFSRAEARDFIDVDALIQAGYSRERLIELAAERDAGFDRDVLAQMLAGAGRFSDRQFLVYGVDQVRVDGIRAQFEDWRQELQRSLAGSARSAAARAASPAADKARTAPVVPPSEPVPGGDAQGLHRERPDSAHRRH